MPKAYIAASNDTQQLLLSYLKICFNRYGLSTARLRYEAIDKAIQLEEDSRREKVDDYYDDIVLPVVKAPVKKVSNFLIDLFVPNPHLFEMASANPEVAQQVKQANTVIEDNAKTSKWSREMILFLKDLPKYNFGGIECDWITEETTSVKTVADPASTKAEVVVGSRSGNKLKRLDPYNTFFDTSVPISIVADSGDFLGYIEKKSATQLYKFMEDTKVSFGVEALLNENKIFEVNQSSTSHHYRPQVKTSNSAVTALSPMQQLFSGSNGTLDLNTSTKKAEPDPTYMYEVTTCYFRLIPKIFKSDVAQGNKVQLWKVVVVNWTHVLYVEKLTNAHGIFPALLCQIDEEGIDDQVKSSAETLIPLQNLQTKMYDARIQGLNRNLNDRALYDSARIDKRHLNDNNPSAKIPVKPNIINPSLDNAYRPIPFQDNLGGTILNELQYLNVIAQRISGLNDPQQGQFQRGNKTLGEFNTVMQNADDDLRTWGKLVEVQIMTPLKYIIKLNMFQFQEATTITAADGSSSVEINPMELRKTAMEFKMADGLLTKDTILDMPTARSFFELMLQSPQLQQFYGNKLPQLVDHVFSSMGFDTTKFAGENAGALAPPPPPEGAPSA